MDPRDLAQNPRNWRVHPEHQRAALESVLSRVGWVEEVLVNRRTRFVIDGHLRVAAALDRGEATVPVRYVDLSEAEEWEVLASLDPIAAMAQTDHERLNGLLNDISSQSANLDGFLNEMREATAAQLSSLAAEHELHEIRGRRPSRRELPIDAYFTYSADDAEALIAVRSGFGLGIQTNNVRPNEDVSRWVRMPEFVDSDYRHYDHGHHLRLVERIRPKYATVRDVMTPAQCEADGIEYVPLEQILAWAYELSVHADHVIVTPKYDCLDRIPETYVLGYSAASRMGATGMPISQFGGRRIHLLGGNWRDQYAYLGLMGDDIVSLSLNLAAKGAMFGTYYRPDGATASVADLPTNVNNGYLVALVLSLGGIGQALYEMAHPEEAGPLLVEAGSPW
jgi:hypothetical protein